MGGTPNNIQPPYKGLAFPGWTLESASPVGALQVASEPNWIVSGARTQALSGQKPGFTTVFPGSQTKRFDLRNLAYGCTTNTQSTIVPAPCKLVLTAQKIGRDAPVQRTVSFSPEGLTLPGGIVTIPSGSTPMSVANFDNEDFKGLTDVRVEATSDSLLGGLELVIVVDNLQVVTYDA